MSKRSRSSQTTRTTSAPRSTGASTGTGTGTSSARRPSTAAPSKRQSRFQRYRGLILAVVVVAVVAVGAAFLLGGSAQPAFACTSILTPAAPESPAPGATPRLGQVTNDMGRLHVATGTKVTYEYCPPSSGSHYNDGNNGPIPTHFYSKDEATVPQGWVHNLEHGMMVVLYRCPEGCDPAAQDALGAVQGQLPNSPLCGFPPTDTVVVTRFDQLPTPYAVAVWGRIYFMNTLDVGAVTTFWEQSADRGPEPQCQNAAPGASPAASPGASSAATRRRSLGAAAPSATALPLPLPRRRRLPDDPRIQGCA